MKRSQKSSGNSAYAAYISGILINVVGFAGATGRPVPLAATRIYQMSFFTGFGVSALVYWSLNVIWPVPGKARHFDEVDLSEYIIDEDRQGSEASEGEKGGSYSVNAKEVDSEKGSVA